MFLSGAALVQWFIGEGTWSSAFASIWATFEELYLLLQTLYQIWPPLSHPNWISWFTQPCSPLSLTGTVFKSIPHISILASVPWGTWSLLVFMSLEEVIKEEIIEESSPSWPTQHRSIGGSLYPVLYWNVHSTSLIPILAAISRMQPWEDRCCWNYLDYMCNGDPTKTCT